MITKSQMKIAEPTGRTLLGLLMLVAGAMKLFVMGADAVTGMLAGIGFPAAAFFAWILIIAEIVSGIAILANYKLEYSVIAPIIILLVATIFVSIPAALESPPAWNTVLLHLIVIVNYWMYGAHSASR